MSHCFLVNQSVFFIPGEDKALSSVQILFTELRSHLPFCPARDDRPRFFVFILVVSVSAYHDQHSVIWKKDNTRKRHVQWVKAVFSVLIDRKGGEAAPWLMPHHSCEEEWQSGHSCKLRPFLTGLFLEGAYIRRGLYTEGTLRFKIGQAYTWREICVSKSIGLAYSWKEIYVSNLQKVFTEPRLEDVDLSKMWPYKYFVHMDRGNQGQKWRGTTQTAINCDTFWLQTLGRHEIQKFIYYCTVFALFYFVFEGTFQVQAPRGLYSEGRFNGGFFALRVWGAWYTEGLIFGILR